MKHHLSALPLCLVLSAGITGTVASAEPPVAPDRPATMDSLHAIPNLRRPTATLLTAGQPDTTAWRTLAAEGVRTVVNLRPQAELGTRDEAAEVAIAGLRYHALPVAGVADITEGNARALWRLLRDVEGPVLVHCASGNRAGALLAVGAALEGGYAPDAALLLGRDAGLAGAEARVRDMLGLAALP